MKAIKEEEIQASQLPTSVKIMADNFFDQGHADVEYVISRAFGRRFSIESATGQPEAADQKG